MRLSVFASNSVWMVVDRVAQMLLMLGTSVVYAKALGPSDFGRVTTVLVAVGVLMPFASFGLNGLLNKFLLDRALGDCARYVLSAFFIKLSASFVCFCFALLWFSVSDALVLSSASFLYAFTLLFYSLQVVESHHQVHSTSWRVARIRFVNVVVFAVLKLYFFFFNSIDIELALYLQSAEVMSYFVMIALPHASFILRSAPEKVLSSGRPLVKGGAMLMLSGFAEAINLKIDVLMLAELRSDFEVGIYAVASRMSESGYFFAAAIATSYFPVLSKAKSDDREYYNEIKKLVFRLILICLVVMISVVLIAYPVINFFYGLDYEESYYVLLIHVLAMLFVYVRAAFSKWIVLENLLHYSLLTHLCGAVVNVVLNVVLIPYWGVYGAAFSTLISYAVSSYFSLFLFKHSRGYLMRVGLFPKGLSL